MRTICSWCGAVIHDDPEAVANGELDSHGMCEACAARWDEKIDALDDEGEEEKDEQK